MVQQQIQSDVYSERKRRSSWMQPSPDLFQPSPQSCIATPHRRHRLFSSLDIQSIASNSCVLAHTHGWTGAKRTSTTARSLQQGLDLSSAQCTRQPDLSSSWPSCSCLSLLLLSRSDGVDGAIVVITGGSHLEPPLTSTLASDGAKAIIRQHATSNVLSAS